MAAQLATRCRIKQKRRWVRRPTSGRTVYAYVGGNPISGVDPLGLRELTPCEKDLLKDHFPASVLDNADIQPFAALPIQITLGFAVDQFFNNSRTDAITLGNTIYMRDDQPNVLQSGPTDRHSSGIGLIAHELAHVFQWQTLGAGLFGSGYLSELAGKGYYNNGYEEAARSYARDVVGDILAEGGGCACP